VTTLSSGGFQLPAIGRRTTSPGGKMPHARAHHGGSEEADVNREHLELTPRNFSANKPFHCQLAMLILYATVSGFLAFVSGAIVSLMAPASVRLAVWSSTTAALSVSAGIFCESRPVTACRLLGHRVLRRLARLSPTS
jgi:hypothetical protein